MQPGEPGYDLLASTSRALAPTYPEIHEWDGSPFAWILAVPSATRGKIGRQLIAVWAAEAGFEVHQTSESNQPYLEVEGFRVIVKMSTLWKSGIYRFQQIKDREFDFCFCLGISPAEVNAWLIPKAALEVYVIEQSGQHTGAGAHETSWFYASPNSAPGWLSPYGDSLDRAWEMLSSALE